jgi:hypothetical protein
VSWPYSPRECPECRFFEPVPAPAYGNDGWEIAGLCGHPRIATDLFLVRTRDPDAMEPCSCFRPRASESALGGRSRGKGCRRAHS